MKPRLLPSEETIELGVPSDPSIDSVGFVLGWLEFGNHGDD
jgi:hypothetical protein